MDTGTSAPEGGGVPHELLTVVSHELRGPLGVTRGYLRLLETQPGADPRLLKTVAQAARATARMADLLDELSEYARTARGERAMATAPASVREVLLTAAGAAALPKTPQVRVEVDTLGDVTALVDRDHLSKAVSALLSAVAQAQTADATVILALQPLDAGHALLRIVPHHLLDVATEERPASLERAGAGLGIAMADLVVRRHGGRLVERWAGDVWAGYGCYL